MVLWHLFKLYEKQALTMTTCGLQWLPGVHEVAEEIQLSEITERTKSQMPQTLEMVYPRNGLNNTHAHSHTHAHTTHNTDRTNAFLMIIFGFLSLSHQRLYSSQWTHFQRQWGKAITICSVILSVHVFFPAFSTMVMRSCVLDSVLQVDSKPAAQRLLLSDCMLLTTTYGST